MRVALVYDRVNKWGGAERVLLALHELFPAATLYTSVYNPKKAQWAKAFDVKTSYLQRFPHVINNHELYPYLMPVAFENMRFDEYDLVISLTSEAAKGIITKPHTKHICYCLTPTRYLWSGYEDYFKNSATRMLTKPLVSYLRKWDRHAASRPDKLVAISKEVRQRIQTYYQRDAEVIYPPVQLANKLKNTQQVSKKLDRKKTQKDYYLIVSRLSKFTKYKRIDLAIQACNALGLPLKIVGSGNWRKELQRMSGPTIEFLGELSDKELIKYYTNCRALLFPGSEDFGLTVIEAQMFGKPVIALRKGGALETIKEKKTGLFFQKQTVNSLIEALLIFETLSFSPEDCKRQATQFSLKSFQNQFQRLVQKVI